MPPSCYKLKRGQSALIVSLPHVGTMLPEPIRATMTTAAISLPDNDWYVDTLYDFLDTVDATIISAQYSRYVIDLNRPADDGQLYNVKTSGLCPEFTFCGTAIYQKESALNASEIEHRTTQYWQPYHAALSNEISRLRQQHKRVILLDAHSIHSYVPALFEGRLPDINIGTHQGRSTTAELLTTIKTLLAQQSRYSWVCDGRFTGGYITRHYGQPDRGIEAFQIELAMGAYLDELEGGRVAQNAQKMHQLRQLLLRLINAVMQKSDSDR